MASYTGGGGVSAFPSRDTILSDLHISKNSYLKYIGALVDEGYVTIRQRNNEGHRGYGSNLYTLIPFPEKYRKEGFLSYHPRRMEKILLTGSIFSGGCGNVMKAIMRDSEIDLTTKAIYGYYSAVDYGGRDLPSVAEVRIQIGAGRDRVVRANHVLESKGILLSRRTGSFGAINYILNHNSPTYNSDKKYEEESQPTYTVKSISAIHGVCFPLLRSIQIRF